jgi:hypothetical protein
MSILDGLTKEYIMENSSLLGDYKHVIHNLDIPLFFNPANTDPINFGLAFDLVVAGWINSFPAVRGVNVFHPVQEGKTLMRFDETQENFENQKYIRFPPHSPINYEPYIHVSENGIDFKSKAKAARGETTKDTVDFELENVMVGFNNEIVRSHEHSGDDNNARIFLGPQRCLDTNWRLPEASYKRRLVKDKDIFDIGYHFSSTDGDKQMSGRYEEKCFAGKNTFNFMNWHNKYLGSPKLDKVIRRMAQCKEFHGTLGGLSFLALSMKIPTTIHTNPRMTWTPQKKVMKTLARRSGATFMEATA